MAPTLFPRSVRSKKSFKSEKCLSSRINLVSENKKKPCPICKKTFSPPNLKRHLKTHLPSKDRTKFRCTLGNCFKEYLTKERLKYHLAKGHSVTEFKCDLCPKQYRYEYGLKNHLQRVHTGPMKKYACNLCDAEFKSKPGKDYHIISAHTGEKAFQCTKCPWKFAASIGLRHHQLVHSESRPHKCQTCSKPFKRGCDLKKHVKRIHSENKDYRCSICGKTFFTKGEVTSHSRTHSRVEEHHSCYFCSKSMSFRENMARHLRTHTQEKPFSCPINSCRYSSTIANNLRRHKQRHYPLTEAQQIASKIYACYFCQKAFSRPNELVLHLRIHTREEPYLCGLCGRTFNQSSSLRVHILTHTKEKSFRCPRCEKCFSIRGYLRNHMISRHSAKKEDLSAISALTPHFNFTSLI